MIVKIMFLIALLLMFVTGVICLFWRQIIHRRTLWRSLKALKKYFLFWDVIMDERYVWPIRIFGVLELLGVAIALFILIRDIQTK